MLKVYEKQICLIIAFVMFFAGMCLDIPEADASFCCTNNEEASAYVFEEESSVLTEASVCTLSMIYNGTASLCRGLSNSLLRGHGGTVILLSIVGFFLQYLFYYQSEECKEDGQLLLCRSVAVKYIHQKDGEK